MGTNNQQRRRAKAKDRRARARAGDGWEAGRSCGSAWRASAFVAEPDTGDAREEADRVVLQVARRVWAGSSQDQVMSALNACEAPVRDHLATAAEDLLRTLVTHAWSHGWQPAELERIARRRSKGAARVLGDAMAGELATYAKATVDPAFWNQLRILDAKIWWPGVTGHVPARATGSGWLPTLTAALEAAGVLLGVGPIEQLVPPPGRATGNRPADAHQHGEGKHGSTASHSGAPRAAAPNDRILARVRGLLAKAESSTFDAEAESFTAAAQALMSRHSIDLAMLDAERSGPTSDRPGAIRIGIDNPYENPKALLLQGIAEANRCRSVWSKAYGFSTVVGFAVDLVAVETLFTSLLIQAATSMARAGSRQRRDGSSRTRAFRAAFLTSFAYRIADRLSQIVEAETAKGGDEARLAGRDLLPVLADRRAETDRRFVEMFPEVIDASSSLPMDREGWAAGRTAADRARLSLGPEVSP